ncbi:MAG TPA: nuclear transport factor 2 family protein [Acidimicrobiia bacterium]|nr:nuclear transport factor 2 family protein [Acidimicrobiia bacterium]
MDPEVRETVDYVALRRLQNAYADIATRRAWAELHDIFVPDIEVVVDTQRGEPFRLRGPQAVGDFIGEAVSAFDFFEFVILNSRVFLNHRTGGDPDAASARMWMNELRHEHAAGGRWTLAYGLYQDDFRRIDGRWWFTGRRYQSLARSGRDFDVFPFPGMEAGG